MLPRRLAFPALVLSALFLHLGSARAANPAAPVVTATALGISSITWTWTLSENATGYRVLSSTGAGNISGDLSAATTSFTLTSLLTNTSATITVEAFNASTVTAVSEASTRYTLAAKPTGTAVITSTNTTAALSWSANGNPADTRYFVDWWSVGASTVIVSTRSVNVTLSNLTNNVTLYFMVQAENAEGVKSAFDLAVSTRIPGPLPVFAFNSTTTVALGQSSITWAWHMSTGAVTYQVFDATAAAISGLLRADQLSFTETDLSTNTRYTRYVQAVNVYGSTATATYSRFTLAANTTGLTLLSLSTATTTEIISWNANTNPIHTTYDVKWWTIYTATVTFLSTQTANVSVGGLFGGGTVYFTVQALNGDGVPANFDSTFYGVVPSTYFASGSRDVAAGIGGLVTFLTPEGMVSVTIASQTFDTAVNVALTVPPANTVPAVSAAGNMAALPNPINLQITASDMAGNPRQPKIPVVITINYGLNNHPGFDLSNLTMARYDEIHGAWVPLPSSRHPSNRSIAGVSDHLSLFAVLGVRPAGDLNLVTVGPNPMRPMVNRGALMTFRNLPKGARVRLYTYIGELVNDLTAGGTGLVAWDGKNRSGSWVASGVYLALIESGGSKRIMHLAIER